MPELAFLIDDLDAGAGAQLGRALAVEVGRQDAAVLRRDEPPPLRVDRVQVALCDEGGVGAELPASTLSRTVLVLLAPPGGAGFERGVELARGAGASFHVNAAAIERLHALGVPARHLQLGYAAGWDSLDPARPVELETIAASGGYVDWPRMLAAMHAGRAVLHEEGLGLAPLTAGRHLFLAAPDDLEAAAEALRADPGELQRVRLGAREFLREALPLELAAAALIGAARTIVAQPLPATGSAPGQPLESSK